MSIEKEVMNKRTASSIFQSLSRGKPTDMYETLGLVR